MDQNIVYTIYNLLSGVKLQILSMPEQVEHTGTFGSALGNTSSFGPAIQILPSDQAMI